MLYKPIYSPLSSRIHQPTHTFTPDNGECINNKPRCFSLWARYFSPLLVYNPYDMQCKNLKLYPPPRRKGIYCNFHILNSAHAISAYPGSVDISPIEDQIPSLAALERIRLNFTNARASTRREIMELNAQAVCTSTTNGFNRCSNPPFRWEGKISRLMPGWITDSRFWYQRQCWYRLSCQPIEKVLSSSR